MKTNILIGWSLIVGAVGVFIPYTILTATFNYPDVLRLPGGDILTQFHNGGATLIFTWLAFALLGFPLLIAYILIGQNTRHIFHTFDGLPPLVYSQLFCR
jgi:hypothetical protein